MNPIAEKIKEFLENHNDFYIASNGVEIILEKVKELCEVSVTLPVDAGENRKMYIDLVVRFKTMEEFVELAGINSEGDLNKIKSSVCWSQYILGNGYVSCMVDWLNNSDICFRRTEPYFTHWEDRIPGIAITMIYSMDLHYYDEVHHALTLPEQFITYIESNKEELIKRKPPKGGFVKLNL